LLTGAKPATEFGHSEFPLSNNFFSSGKIEDDRKTDFEISDAAAQS
jgi:hypothetical protein